MSAQYFNITNPEKRIQTAREIVAWVHSLPDVVVPGGAKNVTYQRIHVLSLLQELAQEEPGRLSTSMADIQQYVWRKWIQPGCCCGEGDGSENTPHQADNCRVHSQPIVKCVSALAIMKVSSSKKEGYCRHLLPRERKVSAALIEQYRDQEAVSAVIAAAEVLDLPNKWIIPP